MDRATSGLQTQHIMHLANSFRVAIHGQNIQYQLLTQFLTILYSVVATFGSRSLVQVILVSSTSLRISSRRTLFPQQTLIRMVLLSLQMVISGLLRITRRMLVSLAVSPLLRMVRLLIVQLANMPSQIKGHTCLPLIDRATSGSLKVLMGMLANILRQVMISNSM